MFDISDLPEIGAPDGRVSLHIVPILPGSSTGGAMFYQFTHRSRQERAQPSAERCLVALPIDNCSDNRQANGGERNGKQHAVLEDGVRKMSQVQRDADATKDGE